VFAIVLSVTVEAYPEGIMSVASLSFNMSASLNENIFWSAIEDFHRF
jgi:hypothetical protein